MNLPSSLAITRDPRSIIAAGALGLLCLSNSAQAVVTVTFAQSGSNVTATLSGSFVLPALLHRISDDLIPSAASQFGSQVSLAGIVFINPYNPLMVNPYDVYSKGSVFASGLTQNPDSFSGPFSFGYLLSNLYVGGFPAPGDTITPTGTWTWNGTTLAAIGLGGLTSVPEIVYQAAPGSGDTIQFVAVPEPSAALLGLASTGFLMRRRRAKQD